MSLTFHLHLVPDELDGVIKMAKLAEDAGFVRLWIAESHLVCRDVFTAVTVSLLNTSRLFVGPGTTNVVLRDATVIANTMATLYELAPGRVALGLGSGDTPVYSLGKKPTTLAGMRKAITQIRALIRGDTVDYNGIPIRLSWSHYNVPIFLAAAGPKTIQLAAEIADGIIVSSGVDSRTLAWIRDNLEKGLERRDPKLGELEIVYAAICSVDEDRERARKRARARAANRAHHNFWRTLESVPPEHRAEVQRLMDNFDVRDWRNPKHAELVTDYLLNRFAIAGTPEECVNRFRELQVYGVKQFMVTFPNEELERNLRLFAEKVMPYV